jgi:hypothetical protein
VARVWEEAAVAQCADVVALDGVLGGAAVTDALSPGAAGRLVLVRTDWTDTFALLEQLSARARDRAALAERLRFVIQVFEVLVVGDPLRAALRAAEAPARLRACAQAEGFRPLADRLQALVASGGVSVREAARASA